MYVSSYCFSWAALQKASPQISVILPGDVEALTAAEILPQLKSARPAAEAELEDRAAAQEEVAGVTAAGLTGPSGKKWLAAGEDEPLVSTPLH